MGIFRKLNAAVVARIRARAGTASPTRVRVDDNGIHVEMSPPAKGGELVEWSDVDAIDVWQQDVYSHRLIGMTLAARHRLLQLDESIDGWQDLLDGIRQYLPDAMPFERWFAELPAAPEAHDNEPLRIYSRGR